MGYFQTLISKSYTDGVRSIMVEVSKNECDLFVSLSVNDIIIFNTSVPLDTLPGEQVSAYDITDENFINDIANKIKNRFVVK